jgi:intraflagellar transport protein 46
MADDKGDLKYYQNQPYDLEVDLGHDDDDNFNDNIPDTLAQKQPEYEQEDDNNTNYQQQEIQVKPPEIKPLPKFDVSKFDSLAKSSDEKDLLNIMKSFTAIEMNLDTKLKPFIPSYLPAIGEVDAFIKVNRPDNLPEELGLTVMDEPTTKGVDKYILEMELAETTKTKIDKFSVKSIKEAEKKPNEINDWINKIGDLQKRKVPTEVNYKNKMPDIEGLMKVWNEKEEQSFKEIPYPYEKLNIPLETYAKIVCNMCDIPIHKGDGKNSKSLIESLHVLFTLYSGFKGNAHFQNIKEEKKKDFQSMKI